MAAAAALRLPFAASSLLRPLSSASLPSPPPTTTSSLRHGRRHLLLLPTHRLKPARPGRPSFQVRASRTESGGVSLGFRAPPFEVVSLCAFVFLPFLFLHGRRACRFLAAAGAFDGKSLDLGRFRVLPCAFGESYEYHVGWDVHAVMFICNHCPFVKHLKKDIAKLTSFYMGKGLGAVAISSNSTITHPQDGPELMAEEAKLFNYPFPYLFDQSQDVARAFGAVCTPEFFLFKKDGRRPFELFYHGQYDDSRPGNNVPVTGRDLSHAIDCILSGQPLSSAQKPSVGCSIKWHPGKSG